MSPFSSPHRPHEPLVERLLRPVQVRHERLGLRRAEPVDGADFQEWLHSYWAFSGASKHDLTNITYDAAGNLATLWRRGETSAYVDKLTYNRQSNTHRLGSLTDAAGVTAVDWDVEAGSFGYDYNGNVTSTPGPYAVTSATYDTRNLPTSLTAGGTTSTYRYDGAGQRVYKQRGSGEPEHYALDGAATVGVFTVDGSGGVTTHE